MARRWSTAGCVPSPRSPGGSWAPTAARGGRRPGREPPRAARASNAELVRRADMLVLSVKPIDVERFWRGVRARHTAKAVASVAAGVATTTMENVLEQGLPVFRLHAERRRQGVLGHAVLREGPFADTDAEKRVLGWLSLLGTGVKLEERLFDAATALAGSGRAPLLGLVIEAFEDAGITRASPAAKARELILSTMVGTANLLDETGISCSDLGRWSPRPGGRAPAGLARCSGHRSAAASSTASSRRWRAPPAGLMSNHTVDIPPDVGALVRRRLHDPPDRLDRLAPGCGCRTTSGSGRIRTFLDDSVQPLRRPLPPLHPDGRSARFLSPMVADPSPLGRSWRGSPKWQKRARLAFRPPG